MGSGYRLSNDPHFQQAMQNIGQMFKPPSAQDMYAAALAKKTNIQAKGLADFYSMPVDAPREDYERAAIATGQYAPNQSYYAVDANNATTLKERQMQEGGLNSRNSADNARMLQERQIQEAAALQRQREQGFKVGQNETLFLPPQVQKDLGLPGQMRGNLSVGQGETIVMPDAQGQVPRVQPQGPGVDGQPLPSKIDPSAMIQGQPKAQSQSQGMSITYDDQGRPIVQMGGGPAGKIPEWQAKFGMGEAGLRPAAETALALITSGFRPSTKDYYAFTQLGQNTATAPVAAALMKPEAQQFYQALRPIVAQQLFLISGQAATEAEVNRTMISLLPVPGEDEKSVAMKMGQIQNLASTVAQLAGPAKVNNLPYTGLSDIPPMDPAALDPNVKNAPRGGVGSTFPPPAPNAEMPVVNTPDEAMALPSGTKFRTPDGVVRVRP